MRSHPILLGAPAARSGAAIARAGAGAIVNYVALGDSSAVGVGAREGGYPARLARRLRAEGAEVDLVNLAVSGATSADVLRGQLQRAIAAAPSVVTLAVGVNDLVRGQTIDRFAHHLDAIGKALAGAGAPVIAANLPDMSLAPVAAAFPRGAVEALVRAYNARLEAILEQHGFHLIDLFAMSRELLPGRPEVFSADGFHPSDHGYEAWAEAMWPVFRQAAVRPAAKTA